MTFIRGDALALGDIGPFDLVVDNHLVHCILGGDRATVLSEIHRVLRPGGGFFSETMSCEGDFVPEVVGADPVTRTARSGTRYWTHRAEYEEARRAAGFEIESLVARPQEPGVGATLMVFARRPILRTP